MESSFMNARAGSGHINKEGYREICVNGRRAREHISIAERALGKALPLKAVVHHVNEQRSDNRNENLVICPNNRYHKLLHQRMRSFTACGHYDWLSCRFCKVFDAPENLRLFVRAVHHKECWNAYERRQRKIRKARK